MDERYRHELKFQIGPADYLAIRQRISPLMQKDPHTRADGLYLIRSIYFDNFDDKALREKVNGVAVREKFRIRYYNDDFSYITLEKKIKHNNLCRKEDAPISIADYSAILSGRTDFLNEQSPALVKELCHKMQTEMLRPKVMVSYVREPYIYRAGNVRVTFDSCIRTSMFQQDFLESKIHDISATECPRDIILEVKYDAFLPEVIADLLHLDGIRQQAFSKYGACRKYG